MEKKSNKSPGVMKDKNNKYNWHKLFLKAYKAMPQLFLESVLLSSLAFALSNGSWAGKGFGCHFLIGIFFT